MRKKGKATRAVETGATSVAKSTRKSIEAFVGLIEDFRAPLGETELSLASWADKFLDEIDYVAELRKGEKDPENA